MATTLKKRPGWSRTMMKEPTIKKETLMPHPQEEKRLTRKMRREGQRSSTSLEFRSTLISLEMAES